MSFFIVNSLELELRLYDGFDFNALAVMVAAAAAATTMIEQTALIF